MAYTDSMEPRSHIDATQHSFDEFISFLFEHEIAAKEDKAWYWNTDVTFAERKICEYYIRLFRNPDFLLGRFPKPQLEQGFWAMMSGVDWSVKNLIDETDVPFPLREACVRAMFDLFRGFFATEPLDTSCYMWWDAMCYDWYCGNRAREQGGEDLEMQDVMYQTLAEILSLDSQSCQAAALHGLGHLHHPETREFVDRYITNHPSLTETQKEYALAASDFQVV